MIIVDTNCYSWDPVWEKTFQERGWGKYPEIPLIRFIARNYYGSPDRKEVRILELGSGCGSNVWYMAREGFDVCAIEGSVTGVEQTKERLKKHKLKATVEVGDFINIHYPAGFFDAVVDQASIQHNESPAIRKILKEVYKVLKEGGKFFGSMLAEDKDVQKEFKQTHIFTRKEIEQLFKGWKDLKIDYEEYTEFGGENKHKSWIVEATK